MQATEEWGKILPNLVEYSDNEVSLHSVYITNCILWNLSDNKVYLIL